WPPPLSKNCAWSQNGYETILDCRVYTCRCPPSCELFDPTFARFLGGFEARVALLNDFSNGQRRSWRARSIQSRRLVMLQRCTGLLQRNRCPRDRRRLMNATLAAARVQ